MAIKKKEFNFSDVKNKFSTKTKYKPESFYNCGEAFMDACGLPGPVLGGINMFLGHSNTSKTTAMILAAADAQKKGHLPGRVDLLLDRYAIDYVRVLVGFGLFEIVRLHLANYAGAQGDLLLRHLLEVGLWGWKLHLCVRLPVGNYLSSAVRSLHI